MGDERGVQPKHLDRPEKPSWGRVGTQEEKEPGGARCTAAPEHPAPEELQGSEPRVAEQTLLKKREQVAAVVGGEIENQREWGRNELPLLLQTVVFTHERKGIETSLAL